MESENLKKLATKAKDVLQLTEALYVAIRRDSTTAADKYLQKAKDLGILKEVRQIATMSYASNMTVLSLSKTE